MFNVNEMSKVSGKGFDFDLLVRECLEICEHTAYDYEGKITYEGMSQIVTEWYNARRSTISRWNGTRLTIETSGIDEQKVRELIAQFVRMLATGEGYTMRGKEVDMEMLKAYSNYPQFSWQIETLVFWMRDQRNRGNILNNKLDTLLNSHDENVILQMAKAQKGMKISKIIYKYLVNLVKHSSGLMTDEEARAYKEIDIICQNYSRIVELFKTCNATHKVVLSIDIRDFLRCSYGYDWKSCHRLGGEYGSGAISYILNRRVAMAYVDDTDNEHLDWRQIVYMDEKEGLFIGSRQYKNENPTFARAVRQIIMKEYGLTDELTCEEVGDMQDYAKTFISRNTYEDFAYNDIWLWHGIDEQIWIVKGEDTDTDTIINIQTDHIYCVTCGELMEYSDSCAINCLECDNEGGIECDYCGHTHSEDEVYWIESIGGYVCLECLENHFIYCRVCHEYVHGDEGVHVHGVGDVCDYCARYGLKTGEYVQCENCLEIFASDYEELEDVDGLALCSVCRRHEHVEYCETCGKAMLESESHEGQCTECYGELRSFTEAMEIDFINLEDLLEDEDF